MKATRLWLIITTVVFGAAGLVGLLGVFLSVFLFDAPGSDKVPAVWVLFCSMFSFSFVCGFAICASWIAFAFKRYVIARCASLLPIVNIVAGAAAMLWLNIMRGGRLN